MANTVSSTTLSFGLVNTPVKLKKASEAKATELKSASPAGNPAGYTWVDKETGELIETEMVQRGVFTDNGFCPVSKEALKAIDEQCKIDSIEIEKFIPFSEVPFERTTGAYFLAPGSVGNGKGSTAAAKRTLALLRDALAERDDAVAGVGKLTLRTKAYPFVVYERDGGLVLNTLCYADEFAQIAEAADSLAGVESDPKSKQLASMLIDNLLGDRTDLDALQDERRKLRETLIAQAVNGEAIAAPDTQPVAPITPPDDLEALLVASVAAAAPEPKPKRKAKVA